MPFRFRSWRKLARHFSDHGADFGAVSEADYEQKADVFLRKPITPNVHERVRVTDGDTIRYDSITEEYCVLSFDGYIRTYYIPDPIVHGAPTNYDYYLRD